MSLEEHQMMFQSTRPCGARLRPEQASMLSHIVSIHAPVRGATYNAPFEWYCLSVSIHAPVRGATFSAGYT